jgi:hypothetical protein
METKNTSPLDSKTVLKKIDKSIVRIAGKQNSKPKVNKSKVETKESQSRKTAEPKEQKPKTEKKTSFTDEQFIAALKEIGHPATSREISDKLGIKDPDVGRQLVRSRMKKLNKEGKVYISEAPEGIRADKVYSVA